MGTDIHSVVQVRENGKWKTICQGLNDRDYDAFAIMANVRNGRGFAGVLTSSRFEWLADARGLPPDFPVVDDMYHMVPWVACDYIEEGEHPMVKHRFWMGDHTYSWLSLKELLGIPWHKQVTKYGYLNLDEYNRWDKKSTPETYSGGVGGRNVVKFDQSDWEHQRIGPYDAGSTVYIHCNWVETYKQAAPTLWSFIYETLPSVVKGHQLDDVRLVFGFDS